MAANASTWSWQATVGSRMRGNRRTISRGGFRTRRAAEAALSAAVAAHDRGDSSHFQPRCDQTVAEHLTEWLATCQVRQHRPLKRSTAAGYRNAIDVWIVPFIGDIALADLSRDDLVKLYRRLRTEGGKADAAQRIGGALYRAEGQR